MRCRDNASNQERGAGGGRVVKPKPPPSSLHTFVKKSRGAVFVPITHRKKLPQIAFDHKAAVNPSVFSMILLEDCLLCLNGNL